MNSNRSTVLIKSPALRRLVFFFGCLTTALGIVGVFLPLLPTTPFLLLAAWCFIRISPNAHQWLLAQPLLGPALKDWEKNGAISIKSKSLAIGMMSISVVWMWFKVDNLYVLIFVSALMASVAAFILSRPHR